VRGVVASLRNSLEIRNYRAICERGKSMPWYTCNVNNVGPATDGTETADPVVYINLTDTAGSFNEQWFYAANGGQNQMLAVALAAMNGQKRVNVAATAPNAGGSPYTSVTRMYLNAT
jgi:hypothetical protein